jgi:hypothetical protein
MGDLPDGLTRCTAPSVVPGEPVAEAVVQVGQEAGRTVGRDDELPAAVVQGGDDVEEFGLEGFGARQELDIVDEHHAGVQVAAAEVVLLAVPGRDRELAAEFRGAYVADVQRRVQLLGVVADGIADRRGASNSRESKMSLRPTF